MSKASKAYRSYSPSSSASSNPVSAKSFNGRRKRKLFFILVLAILVCYQVYHALFAVDSALPDKLYMNNTKEDVKHKQDSIKAVFKESFNKYQQNAWGYDRYDPVNIRGSNLDDSSYPLGWIIVDSLDTLMLMGLDEEVEASRKWVEESLDYDVPVDVSVFETTIRMLGGLLSAYYMSEDELYYNKSIDLANRLLPAFTTATGVPYEKVNLKTGKSFHHGPSSTAEVGTLQLEFKYLAYLSNETVYWDVVEKIMDVIYNTNLPIDGLAPIQIDPSSGKFTTSLIRLGSRGDSYFEYLLKQYLQTGEEIYLDMHKESVEGVKRHLLGKSKPNGLTYIGELNKGIRDNSPPSNKMDHLVCFYPGLLALGATEGLTLSKFKLEDVWTNTRHDDLELAKELTKTCYMMYNHTKTGLAPEIAMFNTMDHINEDIYSLPADRHNLQRPETVESLFYLYRITQDPIYRQWGWEIFENFRKYTKVEGGYSGINNVENPKNVGFRDDMESFWLAETLKYLYLLFEDDFDVLALDEVVFNTEAHPLPQLDLSKAGAHLQTNWQMRTRQGKEEQNSQSNVKLEDSDAYAKLQRGKDRAKRISDSEKKRKAMVEKMPRIISPTEN